jgi:hypothetical protein
MQFQCFLCFVIVDIIVIVIVLVLVLVFGFGFGFATALHIGHTLFFDRPEDDTKYLETIRTNFFSSGSNTAFLVNVLATCSILIANRRPILYESPIFFFIFFYCKIVSGFSSLKENKKKSSS